MHIIQPLPFDFEQFIRLEKGERLVTVLEALDAERLLGTLQRERGTGRKGYSLRGMWAALIAGVLHQSPSLAAMVRLLQGNKEIRLICRFVGRDEVPSEDALSGFLAKLVAHEDLMEACFEGMVEKLSQLLPEFAQKGVCNDLIGIGMPCTGKNGLKIMLAYSKMPFPIIKRPLKAFIRGFFNFLMEPIYQDLPVSWEA